VTDNIRVGQGEDHVYQPFFLLIFIHCGPAMTTYGSLDPINKKSESLSYSITVYCEENETDKRTKRHEKLLNFVVAA
jgi:hypothetical protein